MTAMPTTPAATDQVRAALAAGIRPRRASVLSASLTFGWRSLLKIKHDPFQLFSAVAFPILLTLVFTYLFGGALAGTTGDYLQFFLPGILVMAVAMETMTTGLAVSTDVSKGMFDRIRSLPVWQPAALIGAMAGDAVRYTLASVVVIGLGLMLGFRPAGGVAGVTAAVGVLLVFSFCLTWIWTALALVVRTPDTLLNTSMLVIQPLAFLSNIFVDPATMPSWLQGFVAVNPMTHLVTAVRGLMQATATIAQLGWLLLACAVLTAVFAPLTTHLYRTKH